MPSACWLPSPTNYQPSMYFLGTLLDLIMWYCGAYLFLTLQQFSSLYPMVFMNLVTVVQNI